MRGVQKRVRPERCPVCQLQQWLCVCGHLPRVETSTHIVILRHASERKRPSNTGRVLAAMLPAACLLDVGAPEEPLSGAMVTEAIGATRAIVVYPCPEARILTPQLFEEDVLFPPHRSSGRCLIFLDGTWGQAGRMNRRAPGLGGLPRACLPKGAGADLFLRKNTRENGVSTAEALLCALSVLGEEEEARALARGVAEFIGRARFQTGKSSRERLLAETGVREEDFARSPYPIAARP